MHKIYNFSFVAPDKVSYAALLPLALEARNRGHNVVIGPEPGTSCDLAVYTDPKHRCEGHLANWFAIMFHGLDQGFTPHRWLKEDWSSFDYGFLPGSFASEVWKINAFLPSAHPKAGIYVVGWPKSDKIFNGFYCEDSNDESSINDNWQGKMTLLYAPTIECGDKLDHIVKVSSDIGCNLFVKHAPYDTGQYTKEGTLEESYKKLAGRNNVRVLKSDFDIFKAISLCDILVSDQSSVLVEALAALKVPLSVTDWPIAWGGEKRYKVPYFAEVTLSKDLSDKLLEIRDNLDVHVKYLRLVRNANFPYKGCSSQVVIDCSEELLAGGAVASRKYLITDLVTISNLFSRILRIVHLGTLCGKPIYSKQIRKLMSRLLIFRFLRLKSKYTKEYKMFFN